MEASKLFVIGVVLIGAFVRVNTLQCYECVDCPDSTITDTHLVTCGGDTTTTINVESTASSTTPVESTVASSTAPVESTVASSAAPVESTVASSAVPVESTVASSTAAVESTVASSAAPVQSTVASTTTSVGTTTESNPVQPKAMRVRRHIQPETSKDNGCRCNGQQCACDEETQGAEIERVSSFTDNVTITYVCSKVVNTVNGTEVVAKGCAPSTIGNVEFCAFMTANNVTSCITCDTDKCNSAFSLQHSVVVLLLVLTMGLFTK